MPQTGFEELTEKVTDYRDQGEQLALGATEPKPLERQGLFWSSWVQDLVTWLVEYAIGAASYVAIKLAEIVMRGEDRNEPAFRALTRAAIKDLTGADVGAGHRTIGRTLLDSLAGGAGAQAGGELAPSRAGAEAYMEIVMQLALEGYVEGGITSALSAGFLDKFTELDDILAQVLGLGRMSRRVMGPLMNARVITPFQWHVNKEYRPELLSVSSAVRQFLRGRWDRAQLDEELARQGWSTERIEAFINEQRKYFSASDVRQFNNRGWWTREQSLQHLKDQGYTLDEAEDVLRLEGLRRIEQLEGAEASLIITAYANREIGEADFARLMAKYVNDEPERHLLTELAQLRRDLNLRYLSSPEVWALAHDEILSVIDYRRALEREGYVPDAVIAKELQLRRSLDAQRDLAKARAEQAAAREAERQAREQEKAERTAELAARRALPTLQEYERAYVRGRIGIDAFIAAIRREKVAITEDDVALLVSDAEEQRVAWLLALERRARADAQLPDADVPVAKWEQAVLEGIHTLSEFDAELAKRGYDDAERRIQTALVGARLDDQVEAKRRRDEAAARAATRGISLPDFERAVRMGVRTSEQYAAFLRTIETPELARGLILDVLAAQLRQDADARAKRTALDAAGAAQGISLAQRRRAVIAGIRPRTYYEAALVAARWPVDDQLVELALVDAEIAAGAAARARRDALAAQAEQARAAELAAEAEAARRGAQAPPPKTLSLAQYERAFILGLLTPDQFRAAAAGFRLADEDVELLVQLAVAKVPDARDAAARETAIAAELAAKRIALADVKRAVKAGRRTIDEYEALLVGEGYGADDAALLVGLLNDEIVLDVVRLRARIEAALAKRDDAPPLDVLEQALRDEDISGAELVAILEAYGVGGDVARVFVGALRSGYVET